MRLSEHAVQKIKKFVGEGGYLFSEDWALTEILERAWPEFVGTGKFMIGDTVEVNAAPGSTSNPYLRKIFAKELVEGKKGTQLIGKFDKVKHEWKVDEDSPAINIKDEKSVTVLLESEKIGKDYGSSAMSITFVVEGGRVSKWIPTGLAKELNKIRGGRVLHVVSHFGKQKSQDDEYTIQNLLVNFMIEAIQRYIANNPDYKKEG